MRVTWGGGSGEYHHSRNTTAAVAMPDTQRICQRSRSLAFLGGIAGDRNWFVISTGSANSEQAGNLVIAPLPNPGPPYNTVFMHSNLSVDGTVACGSGRSFTGGSLTTTGPVSGSSFDIGGTLFDSGSYASQNAFLGFARAGGQKPRYVAASSGVAAVVNSYSVSGGATGLAFDGANIWAVVNGQNYVTMIPD